MPGTLQVSVLELLDIPSSGQVSLAAESREWPLGSVSLKIALGKTEFRTSDKGDFSFPVMSLRENLKLALLDADDNEISQTDVKIITVVEKRYWSALFPLDGGGSIHLNLQFILNAEENKRICAMREAVLKRKYDKFPRSNSKDSVHAFNVRRNIIEASASVITEEVHAADQLSVKSQDVQAKVLFGSWAQDHAQQPEDSHVQDAIPEPRVNEEFVSQTREKSLFSSLAQDLPQQPQDHHLQDVILLPRANEDKSVYQSREKRSFASLAQDLPRQPDDHRVDDAFPQPRTNKGASDYKASQGSNFKAGTFSGEATNSQLRKNESLVLGEVRGTLSSPVILPEEIKVSMNKESAHDKFSVTNTKKLISAFENIPVQQERRINVKSTAESQLKWAKSGNSSRVLTAKQEITERITTQKMMSKSLSSGTLPQMNSEPLNLFSAEAQKQQKHTELGQSVNAQNLEKFDSGNESSGKFLCTAESPNDGRTGETSESVDTKEVIKLCSSDDIGRNASKHPLHKGNEGQKPFFKFRHYEDEAPGKNIGVNSFLKGASFLTSKTSNISSNVRTSGFIEERREIISYRDKHLYKMATESCGEERGIAASLGGNEWIDTSEIRQDKDASVKDFMLSRKAIPDSAITGQLRSSSSGQRQLNLTTVKAETGINRTGVGVYKLLSRCQSLNDEIGSSYFDPEQCLLGTHDNSIPTHFCITSGSKQLKDIIGGFISF